VEEEFLLVDPQTGESAPRNAEVAAEAERTGVTLELELSSCQVETTSKVATTSTQLGEELARLRRTATQAAEAAGVRLLALGLPPVTPREFPVTDTERYRRIGAQFGMVAHEQGICGCHVHVQVPDRAAAIQVSNWLRPWLPSLLALSANSAIYRNADSGYASWRSVLWRRWPVAGAPPFFTSPEEFDRAVRMLVDTGVILDQKMIYWDVRPSTNFPTIEIRVADVPATVAETLLTRHPDQRRGYDGTRRARPRRERRAPATRRAAGRVLESRSRRVVRALTRFDPRPRGGSGP
jgi:glutamate---cysteine ligase / carboxylate-amine ligase